MRHVNKWDKSFSENAKITKGKERRTRKKLALFTVGLSISSGVFALDQNCWTAADAGGSLQIVERSVPGCFPTAVAAQTAMIDRGSELDRGYFGGWDGYSWGSKPKPAEFVHLLKFQ